MTFFKIKGKCTGFVDSNPQMSTILIDIIVTQAQTSGGSFPFICGDLRALSVLPIALKPGLTSAVLEVASSDISTLVEVHPSSILSRRSKLRVLLKMNAQNSWADSTIRSSMTSGRGGMNVTSAGLHLKGGGRGATF